MKTDFISTVKCERAQSVPRYEVGLFVLIESDVYPYYYLEKYDPTDNSYLVRIFDCNFKQVCLNYYSEISLARDINKTGFTKEEQINLMFIKNKLNLAWEV